MNQKKLFPILLLTLSFLGGCPQGPSRTEKTITLTAWVTYQGAERKKFDQLIAQFTREYKKQTGKTVKILAKQVPFDDLITNIKMACLSNRTPDIARIDVQKVLELAYHKVLVPLDQLENFIAPSIEAKGREFMKVPYYTNVVEVKNNRTGKRERHLYGLPEQTTCLALFWNRRIFREFSTELEKAGLDPKRAPRTWDELIRYGLVMTGKKEGNQYYGFGMRNSLWWTLPFFGVYGAPFIQTRQGKKVCLLGGKASRSALQLKVDLYQKYKIEAGAWKSGSLGNNVGFANGKYAMIFMGPWRIKEFKEKGLDFGVALIPGVSKKRAAKAGLKNLPFSATNVGGNNMVIFQSCKYKKEAYDFLKFLTSWKTQLEWCLDLGQIPINRKTSQILLGKIPYSKKIEVDGFTQVFMEQIRYAVLPPRLPRYGYIEGDIVNPEMELALKGEKSVKKALETAAEKINREVMSLVNE